MNNCYIAYFCFESSHMSADLVVQREMSVFYDA